MSTYFAYNLKYLREKKGWSQNELSIRLNVARSTISCWENGIRLPRVDKIMEIAKLFQIKQDIVGIDIRNQIIDNECDILLAKLEKDYGVQITIQKNAILTKKTIEALRDFLCAELDK